MAGSRFIKRVLSAVLITFSCSLLTEAKHPLTACIARSCLCSVCLLSC